MKICVIGAGVIGCATAYQLCRMGHEVTLVDSAATPGAGASFANGAQLSYSYVEPLANPSTFKSIPHMLLAADSPLGLRLRPSMGQWRWILDFLRSCTPGRSRRGNLALLATASQSRVTLDRWIRDDGLDIAIQRNGKLVLCPDQPSFAHQARQVRLQAEAGAEQVLLDRSACLAREPALASYKDFVGGVWTQSECAADPRTYCDALVASAIARGARGLWSTTVDRFVVENKRVVSLQTSAGDVTADAYVLAAGVNAPQLARQLGESLLIEPIKGYSLTLEMHVEKRAPSTSVTDLGQKTVLAPLNGRLRVAAIAELGCADLRIPDRRLEQIKRTVETIYPGLCNFNAPAAWAGLRPATPDSLPVVRQSRIANVFLNVGHGALGFTLASGCAVQVAEAIHDARGAQHGFAFSPSSPTAQQEGVV